MRKVIKTLPTNHENVKSADRLYAFVARINASLKKRGSLGRVDLGKDIQYLDPKRLPSGSLGLDIATSGGIPRGHKTEMWGPWSTGKTTTALGVVSHNQAVSQIVSMWAAVETFSKKWARKRGIMIPYSGSELMELRKTRPKYAKRVEKEQEGWPPFILATHTHGDALLEIVYETIRDNVADLVVLDSLGAVVRYDDVEERSVEDQKYGGQSTLFSAFCNKCYSAFNRKYDPKTGEIVKGGGEGLMANNTALICINQARQKIGWSPSGQTRYKPVGGEALRHFWDLSIEFSHGPRFSVKKGDKKEVYAQEIQAFVDKSKVGPPQMEAQWMLYTKDRDAFKAGQVDVATEVQSWGDHFGLFDKRGSNFYLGEERFQGAEALISHLREAPGDLALWYNKIVAEAKRRNT